MSAPRSPAFAWTLVSLLWVLVGLGCRPIGTEPEGLDDPAVPDATIVARLDPAGVPPWSQGPPLAEPLPPELVDVGPHGEVGQLPRIYLRFNQAMQAPAEGAPPLIRLEPAVPGTVHWTDSYQLAFSPEHGLRSGQAYVVVAEGTLETVDGRSMTLDRRWSIAVDRAEIEIEVVGDEGYPLYFSDGQVPVAHWKSRIMVTIDRVADLAELREHLAVRGRPQGKPKAKLRALDFRVRRPTKRERKLWENWYYAERTFFIVEPRGHWPADTLVEVKLDTDFHAKGDSLGLGAPLVARLVTHPGLGVDFRCDTEYDDGCDPGPVHLRLDNAVTARQVAKIEVRPRPAKLEIEGGDDYGEGITEISINGRFMPGKRYTISIGPGFRDVHGQPLSKPFRKEVAFVMPPPELHLSSARGFLPADQPTTIGIESRSLVRARLRVAVLEDEAAVARASRPVDEGFFPEGGATVTERILDLDPQGQFEWSSMTIDLATFSKGERRSVFVEVEPLELSPAAAGRTEPATVRGLYQVTDLGAFAMISSARSLAHVSQLSTGMPLADAEVQLFEAEPTLPAKTIGPPGQTNAEGIAPLPSAGRILQHESILLVRSAANDDRFVMGPQHLSRLAEGPGKGFVRGEKVLASVVTERPLYRPGETIHVVGWATVSTPHTSSGLRPVPKKTRVEVTLLDHAGEVVLRRKVRVKSYGKFWTTMALPDSSKLGSYTVQATVAGTSATVDVRLKRFRTPPFSVDAAVDHGDFLHGGEPNVTVGASYYFGGRVPIASARRHEQCDATYFRPPGLESQWVVGHSTEGFPYGDRVRHNLSPDPEDKGRLQYTIDLSALQTSWAFRCTSSVAVQDAAAAEVGADASFMVHPSRYLLMGMPLTRIETGDSIEIPLRTVDHRAKRIAGVALKMKVTRTFWEKSKGRWVERQRVLPSCRVETTAKGDDPVCRLRKLGRGSYEIETTTQGKGPKARATQSLWVGGRWRPRSTAKVERFDLEVSDAEPRPGDSVKLTLRSPKASGRGVIVLMHGGVRTVEPFELRDGRYEHTVSVVDAWVPTVEVEAVLVHPATATRQTLLERVSRTLRVTPEHRALLVEVSAPDVSGPRQTIPIEITLHDAEGEAIAGHVALWAVDEAVLSLAEPVIPDLVAAFVVDRGSETRLYEDYGLRLFPYVTRDDPYEFGWLKGVSLIGRGGGGGSGFGGRGDMLGGTAQPQVRKNFDATPIFLGDVEVGPTGYAMAEGTLPDNLTTFRITAIASAELVSGDAIGRFGHADTRVRVTSPLVVQAVLPRHLRPGDEAEFAALIDNLGGPAGVVTVAVGIDDPEGAVQLLSSTTVVKRVEAGGQIRVPFQLKARGPGEPRIAISATLAAEEGDVRLSDAIELPVPVKIERGVMRQVAVYGSLADDEPAAIAVKRPEAARANAGGLDVALSSTLLGGAEDMVQGLVDYPYGCVEQTSSRLLPLAALGELAKHYPLGVGDLDRFVQEGVARLQTMEVSGGGLGYWPDDTKAHPYGTAYAAWVLGRLDRAGYAVPPRLLKNLRSYLRDEVTRWASHGTPTIHDDVRLAMALHTLEEGGSAPSDVLGELYERRERLPLFTRAMVLMTLHTKDPSDARVGVLAEELLGGLDERDGFAHVRDGGRWLGRFFDSGPRTEAMVLLALLHAVPDDRRVEKLARGLMELRRSGAMRNTQERAYALMALAEYARRFEAEVPAFDTAVWVDTEFVGGERFEGRSANVQALDLPLPWIEGHRPDDARVTLSRRGEGRMYYRVAMRWAPEEATLEPHAAGITVERTLRSVAGPLPEDGEITHGEMIALDLTLTTNDTLDYVAIDIPLPAGLEAVDTSIGKGRRAMVLRGRRGWWVSHTELETDRALVFADRLSPGKHHHTVFLRAITPGEYQMPPTKAEAMYYPEIQGHTAASRVKVVR